MNKFKKVVASSMLFLSLYFSKSTFNNFQFYEPAVSYATEKSVVPKPIVYNNNGDFSIAIDNKKYIITLTYKNGEVIKKKKVAVPSKVYFASMDDKGLLLITQKDVLFLNYSEFFYSSADNKNYKIEPFIYFDLKEPIDWEKAEIKEVGTSGEFFFREGNKCGGIVGSNFCMFKNGCKGEVEVMIYDGGQNNGKVLAIWEKKKEGYKLLYTAQKDCCLNYSSNELTTDISEGIQNKLIQEEGNLCKPPK
ncbi:MAG: hypothetical protein QXY64_01500 [Candidatus Bilamarchaeaceae archaeon]